MRYDSLQVKQFLKFIKPYQQFFWYFVFHNHLVGVDKLMNLMLPIITMILEIRETRIYQRLRDNAVKDNKKGDKEL